MGGSQRAEPGAAYGDRRAVLARSGPSGPTRALTPGATTAHETH